MRFLREAALYAGLGAVPALAMHYAPLGGLLLSPVLVASQAASFLRGGMMMGTAVALVLGGMLLALLGATQVFVSSVALILLGGCMAFGVGKWGVGFASLCLACSLITLLVFAWLWVFALQVGYQSPFAFLTESMVRAGAGVNEASLPEQNLRAFATWFGLSFPALLCCTFSWEGFAALALLVHLGIAKMPQEGLLGIHFSDAWVWPLLGGGFGLLLIQYEPMKALAWNCLLIGVAVFFFRGLCLVLGVLERLGLPFALKVAVGLMHVLVVPLTAISVFIGLLDVWFDIQGRAKALRFGTEG
jgi:hypothetical protein